MTFMIAVLGLDTGSNLMQICFTYRGSKILS